MSNIEYQTQSHIQILNVEYLIFDIRYSNFECEIEFDIRYWTFDLNVAFSLIFDIRHSI